MKDNIGMQDLSITASSNISNINDDLNIIVIVIGSLITFGFFLLYFTKLKSKQLLNYVPNVWTSLGILGTFIAIIVSLHGGNTSALSDVDTLVKNIVPAFTTSIIGIIGAVVCSIGIKIIYAIEEKKEEELYYKKGGEEISPELLLNNIHLSLRRLIEVTQLQETNIKSFLNNYIIELTKFYNHIFEANKEQVKILSDEYVHSVGDVLASANREINKRIDTILLSHSESIQEYLKAEKSKLNEIADEIKSFFKGIPESVDEMKIELIDSLRNMIIEKYNLLLEGNDAYTNQLIERVTAFESELSKKTDQQCQNTLINVRTEIQKIITLLEESLTTQSASIHQLTTGFSNDVDNLIMSVTKSSENYEAMVCQLNKLIPILENSIGHTEKSVSIAEQSSLKLSDVLDNLEEVVKKNQQLRYELMQWKRVHKKVKINDKAGTKECPNCGAENPMEANFCRKCNYGFWVCETISSSLK